MRIAVDLRPPQRLSVDAGHKVSTAVSQQPTIRRKIPDQNR
jgi:hypothetical protein